MPDDDTSRRPRILPIRWICEGWGYMPISTAYTQRMGGLVVWARTEKGALRRAHRKLDHMGLDEIKVTPLLHRHER